MGGLRSRWRLTSLALAIAGCGHIGFGSGTDASATADGSADSAPPGPPQVITSAIMSNTNAASISYPLSVDSSVDRVLLVSVHIAVKLAVAPPVLSVTYGGAPLTLVTFEDVAMGIMEPRTEVWMLVAPPTGTATVAVQLQAVAVTLHSGAVELAGIDPSTPVRTMAQTNGQSGNASAVVTTSPGDLAIDFVGQGTGITTPATGQTAIWVHDVSVNTSLDNTGSSDAMATGTSMTMGWVFAGPDYWQQIAFAMRPAT
jgi:hypothetical protein